MYPRDRPLWIYINVNFFKTFSFLPMCMLNIFSILKRVQSKQRVLLYISLQIQQIYILFYSPTYNQLVISQWINLGALNSRRVVFFIENFSNKLCFGLFQSLFIGLMKQNHSLALEILCFIRVQGDWKFYVTLPLGNFNVRPLVQLYKSSKEKVTFIIKKI